MKALVALFFTFVSLFAAPLAAADDIETKRAIHTWIVKESGRNAPTAKTIERIVDAVYNNAYRQNIDPFVLLSVMHRESRFNPNAKSKAGAKGLMQVMPRWHQDKIKKRNILNIETNIEVGSVILSDCIARTNSVRAALSCYSGGAKKYESHLKKAFASLRQAEVLHRFANDLPLRAQSLFATSFNTGVQQQAKVKVAGYIQ